SPASYKDSRTAPSPLGAATKTAHFFRAPGNKAYLPPPRTAVELKMQTSAHRSARDWRCVPGGALWFLQSDRSNFYAGLPQPLDTRQRIEASRRAFPCFQACSKSPPDTAAAARRAFPIERAAGGP